MSILNEAGERDHAPLVLMIDDAGDTMRLLGRILQQAGYRTLAAEDGEAGIELAERYPPNAILLDVVMPGMDGYVVCRELKSRLVTAEIPVMFVTGAEPTDEVIRRCFEAGAHDLLTKPINKINLLARLKVVIQEQELRESYRRLATTDFQTGLNNRRQFFLHLMDAMRVARRDKTESMLLLGNIDGLSRANEQFGYDFGDEVILTLARLLKRFNSPDCHAGRIAGDTLAVALKHCSQQRATAFARRVSQTFAAVAFDADTSPKHFTVSFGLACYAGDPPDHDADAIMSEADIALFYAKQVGRGRCCPFWTMDRKALPEVSAKKRHARRRARSKTNRAFVGALDGGSRRRPADDSETSCSAAPGPPVLPYDSNQS